MLNPKANNKPQNYFNNANYIKKHDKITGNAKHCGGNKLSTFDNHGQKIPNKKGGIFQPKGVNDNFSTKNNNVIDKAGFLIPKGQQTVNTKPEPIDVSAIVYKPENDFGFEDGNQILASINMLKDNACESGNKVSIITPNPPCHTNNEKVNRCKIENILRPKNEIVLPNSKKGEHEITRDDVAKEVIENIDLVASNIEESLNNANLNLNYLQKREKHKKDKEKMNNNEKIDEDCHKQNFEDNLKESTTIINQNNTGELKERPQSISQKIKSCSLPDDEPNIIINHEVEKSTFQQANAKENQIVSAFDSNHSSIKYGSNHSNQNDVKSCADKISKVVDNQISEANVYSTDKSASIIKGSYIDLMHGNDLEKSDLKCFFESTSQIIYSFCNFSFSWIF